MGKTWRDRARPIIQQVLRDAAGSDEREIKKALYDAYPFGQREYHPYKIWLDEIRIQRKLKKAGKAANVNPDQRKLF